MIKSLISLFDKGTNQHVTGKKQNRSGLLQAKLRRFRNEEDGSLIIFSLFLFAMMLMIGGLAVDVMRAEYRRTQIQYTLDRAVLAATSLQQTVPAQEVVNDYFEKAGMGEIAPTVDVEEVSYFDSESGETRVTNRSVYANMATIDTSPKIKTIFLGVNWRGIMGLSEGKTVDYLATPALSHAVNGIASVEVSLVLDVSGSMRWDSESGNTKIEELQVAAKEFVDTLLPEEGQLGTTSISIIPYSVQVAAGSELLNELNVTNEHNYSTCINFSDDEYSTTTIDPSVQLQREGYFTYYNTKRLAPNLRWKFRSCPEVASRRILPMSGDATELKNYIDTLRPEGWTSTEIGLKWGAALLDPSINPAIETLIDNGTINTKFREQPRSFSDREVMKVIVVMTDGANTRHFELKPEFREGLSNVWAYIDPDDGLTSYWVYNPSRSGNKYLLQRFTQGASRRKLPNNNYSKWVAAPDATYVDSYVDPDPDAPPPLAVQLTMPELWQQASVRFVSDYLQYRAQLSRSVWRNAFTTTYGGPKDSNMDAICSAAKDNNIRIFSIGFEVGDDNALKLQSCATRDSDFHRVNGVTISEAFAEIAAQLNSLRLIQ